MVFVIIGSYRFVMKHFFLWTVVRSCGINSKGLCNRSSRMEPPWKWELKKNRQKVKSDHIVSTWSGGDCSVGCARFDVCGVPQCVGHPTIVIQKLEHCGQADDGTRRL
jgi:hypothetical protein